MSGLKRFPASSMLLCAAMAAFALVPRAARADDFKLKDGTKVTGEIVGFEDKYFKVKTSYGFALVQKDQVVSISMSEAPKPEAAEEKMPEKPKAEASVAPSAPAQSAAPASKPASSNTAPSPTASVSASKPASLSAPSPMPNPVATSKAMAPTPAPAAAANKTVAANASASAAPPAAANAAPAAAPPKPTGPEPIREQVTGNTYTNETYRFHMYKPPDWDVIASAPAVLPGAITAMGTADDTTYLLIGQEAASKPLAAEMDATEHRLRDVMENFRQLGEEKVTVSGMAAIEHHFRGSVDQHDWSGVVVLVPRGAQVYTIFGMTRADNDLFQLQENVISRAIASLQFSD